MFVSIRINIYILWLIASVSCCVWNMFYCIQTCSLFPYVNTNLYDATLHISNTVFRLGTSPARLNNCHGKRPIVHIWYEVFWMCIQESQCSPFCCCSGEGTNFSNAPQCYDNGSIMFCYVNAYARIHHQPVQTYILDFFCWKSKSHMFNQK